MTDFEKRKELEEFRHTVYEVKFPDKTITVEANNLAIFWNYVKWLEKRILEMTEANI